MRILFMGHQKWGCLALEALLKKGHKIVGVVTERDSFDDASYKALAEYGCYDSLKEFAKKQGLQVYQPDDANDAKFIKVVDGLAPELIVIVSYHTIIKKQLIEKYRIINAHGAPLPHYRGRAPINWAIINGEQKTGVTVHFIDEGVDTGPIILQEMVGIGENEAAIEVMRKTLPLYGKLVVEAVDRIEKGTVKRTPQDPYSGTYFPKRTAEDGLIDWGWDTQDLHNWIRALTRPYPGAFTLYRGRKLFVWESEIPKEKKRVSPIPGIVFGRTKEGGIKVSTRDSFIILKSAQIEGEEEKAPAESVKIGDYLR
ncbi:MAG: methionyl-tRNA formyltransferase [Candidatus Altiarchaeota archaeon]|nr:methionyl-tRNA formyltransferase [Candidatus Altiarchaeota archaeon]